MRNTPCCNQPGTMPDGSAAMAWEVGGVNAIRCQHCSTTYGPVVDQEEGTGAAPSMARQHTIDSIERGAEFWVCFLDDGTTIGVPLGSKPPDKGDSVTLFGLGVDRPVRAMMAGERVVFDSYDELAEGMDHWRTRALDAERMLHGIDRRYGPLLGGLDTVFAAVGGVRRQLSNFRRASGPGEEKGNGPRTS